MFLYCVWSFEKTSWYKWKRRYNVYDIDGLKNQSKRRLHNIENIKIVNKELEKIILELAEQ